MNRSRIGYTGWLIADATRRRHRRRRVAVDETAVKINGEWFWLYTAIDIESKLILDVALLTFHNSWVDSQVSGLNSAYSTTTSKITSNSQRKHTSQGGQS